MNIFKKLSIASTVTLATPLLVSAQYGGMQGSGAGLSITTLGIALGNAVWVVFTIIAVIMFVVSGVQFLSANGDGEKVKTARHSVIWGLVGIVVAIFAYSAISFVRGSIGA